MSLILLTLVTLLLSTVPSHCEGIESFTPAAVGCSGANSFYGFREEIAAQAPSLICVAVVGFEHMLEHSCVCGAYQGAGYLTLAELSIPDLSLCWAPSSIGPVICRQVVACGVVQDPMIFSDGFESGDISAWTTPQIR